MEATTEIVHRIGKTLHEAVDRIRQEPVPERWVDLIHRLNAEEDAERVRGAARRLRSATGPDRGAGSAARQAFILVVEDETCSGLRVYGRKQNRGCGHGDGPPPLRNGSGCAVAL